MQARQPLQVLQEAKQSVQQIAAASDARIAQIQEQGPRRAAARDAMHVKREQVHCASMIATVSCK